MLSFQKQVNSYRSCHTVADVTVVTVHFKSSDVIHNMLKSLPDGCSVVVVDNSHCDPFVLQSARQNLQVLRNQENLGFGAACNIGARAAQTEFIFFLNPDTELRSGALDALLRASSTYQTACAFNPQLLDERGRRIHKHGSVLLSNFKRTGQGETKGDHEIQILSGSAIFVRKLVFFETGGFDENIFLYHEDDDLSLRLQLLGKLMHIEDAVVIHREGHSCQRTPESAAWRAYHMGRSRVYATRKHNLKFAFTKSLFSAFLGLFSPDMLFSKRKFSKRTSFLQGVWSARIDGGLQKR